MPKQTVSRFQVGGWSSAVLGGCLLGAGLWLAGCSPILPPTPVADGVSSVETTAPISASVSAPMTATRGLSETGALTVSVEMAAAAPVTTSVTVTAQTPGDPALVEAGLAVYRQQYCGVCHELDAAGTRGTFGPTHHGLGATAAQRILSTGYSGYATNAAEYIRESLLDPQIYIVEGYGATPHRMPPYTHLDSASLGALVAFLLAQ